MSQADESSWMLRYDTYDPSQQGLREALCTLGNGSFATRGAAEEAEANEIHYPGTYVAGAYNRLTTEIAERSIENEDLVNMPNWLCLTFRVENEAWFHLDSVEMLAYRQALDLQHGVLSRTCRFRDAQGRETSLRSRRLVHMDQPHLAAIEMTLRAENWSGQVQVRSALDGRVTNAGVERYQQLNGKHLEPVGTERLGPEKICLRVHTTQSQLHVAEAARTQVFQSGSPTEVEKQDRSAAGYIAQELSFTVTAGKPITIEKIVAVYTSRDLAISECGLAAATATDRAGRFHALLYSHSQAWQRLWAQSDIVVEGNPRVQLLVRFHLFHLLQTVSPHTADLDVGVPARGWHGEAYRGHIFWDELFIFPLLNFQIPELTRALLLYRYRRLPEARWAAKAAGYAGALYPWQSGSTGREESQELHLNPKSGRWVPDHSQLQRHVNAAIAYNIWQYYQATADHEFMSRYGAEMLLEIARLWASLSTYDPDSNRYDIHGVMGPDEYHDSYPGAQQPGVDTNAYTNILAVWTLQRARDALALLAPARRTDLCQQLQLDDEELNRWADLTHKMRVEFHDDGIISQFAGYDALEELDWNAYREKYKDIQRLDRILEAEQDTPNRYKLSKQADVLMLCYLFSAEELKRLFRQLGYPFAVDTIPKNIAYYKQRTAHGSTLSRVVHSWVLARSDRRQSWQLFTEALESDVSDIQGGTTPEGIHLGAMASTVDLLQRCYTGIELRDEVLWLNPCLPEPLRTLSLSIRYRRHWLSLTVTPDTLSIGVDKDHADTLQIGFHDQVYTCASGQTHTFRLSPGARSHV